MGDWREGDQGRTERVVVLKKKKEEEEEEKEEEEKKKKKKDEDEEKKKKSWELEIVTFEIRRQAPCKGLGRNIQVFTRSSESQ